MFILFPYHVSDVYAIALVRSRRVRRDWRRCAVNKLTFSLFDRLFRSIPSSNSHCCHAWFGLRPANISRGFHKMHRM